MKSFTFLQPTQPSDMHSFSKKGAANDGIRLYFFLSVATLILFNIDSLLAVEVADLRAPMQNLKKEIWSYMFAIKLAAVAVGAVWSVTQQSLMPFGVGAAIGGGIQFFDSVLGDGSAALI